MSSRLFTRDSATLSVNVACTDGESGNSREATVNAILATFDVCLRGAVASREKPGVKWQTIRGYALRRSAYIQRFWPDGFRSTVSRRSAPAGRGLPKYKASISRMSSSDLWALFLRRQLICI